LLPLDLFSFQKLRQKKARNFSGQYFQNGGASVSISFSAASFALSASICAFVLRVLFLGA